MIRKIKQWFYDRFLPMWAKETVLKENRELLRQNEDLQKKLEIQRAYIAGLETGTRALRRIVVNNNNGRLGSENADK